MKQYYQEHREDLLNHLKTSEHYAARLVYRGSSLSKDDLPAQLIETKQQQLELHRLAQQLKKANHEGSKNTY